MNQNNKVAIIGAGRLGKGFLGASFIPSNYEVTFFDVNQRVIDKLNKGYFNVDIHYTTYTCTKTYKDYYTCCLKEDNNAVMLLSKHDIFAISIYPEDFKNLYRVLVEALSIRIKKGFKTSVLVFTNALDYASVVEQNILLRLNSELKKEFSNYVEVKETIIIRSTFAEDNVNTELQTLAVQNSFVERLNFNDISDVSGIEETDNINILKQLKLYTLNGPHAAMAYSGYYRGYATINEAETDSFCSDIAKGVSILASQIATLKYNLPETEIAKISLPKTEVAPITDSISRVAFDPVRKLGRLDRLVYPALVGVQHNLDVRANAKAIALGFLYDDANDPHSKMMQDEIKKHGIEKAIIKFCGLELAESQILKLILQYYNEFKKLTI